MKTSANPKQLDSNTTSRRAVLKVAGTVGLLSALGVTGTAAARSDNYGNGNGVGAFLTEDAAFKNQPLWSSGVADETGQSAVNVTVGAFTSIDVPDPDAPEQGPFAFDPKAVEVSPGTDVTFTWPDYPGFDIHHSVTSYNASASDKTDHGQLFDFHGEDGDAFTHTFDTIGNYLYFCFPHGTPYPLDFGAPIGEVENLVGMRGAVIVSDE